MTKWSTTEQVQTRDHLTRLDVQAQPKRPELVPPEHVIVRESERPQALDYIAELCQDFVELRGDRLSGDDPALIGGLGRTIQGSVVIVGNRKRRDGLRHGSLPTDTPHSETYRKALRLIKQAEKFGFPLLYMLDSPSPNRDTDVTEHHRGWEFAQHHMALATLSVPFIVSVIGTMRPEDVPILCMADRVLMLEHMCYEPDCDRVDDLADQQPYTAHDLWLYGMVDQIIPEAIDGAQTDPYIHVTTTVNVILDYLAELHHGVLLERYAESGTNDETKRLRTSV